MTNLTQLPEWQALIAHHAEIKKIHLRDWFATEPKRADRYTLDVAGILLDYSKNLFTQQTLDLLCGLAGKLEVAARIEAMFNGQIINLTEQRPALHTALRHTAVFNNPPANAAPFLLEGVDILAQIRHAYRLMSQICTKIHRHEWLGCTGKVITDVVNIGIGGSDLGPAMVTEALTPFHQHKVNCHFVSNIDATHILGTLKKLNPAQTLFIVASKSFTTLETLTNAATAKQWLEQKLGRQDVLAQHFIAITAQAAKAKAHGFSDEHILPIWDWVGGRYSLWSAIGLPIALAIGMKNFNQLLNGAHAMDHHFRQASLEQNMPVILALLGIWYHNFYGAQTYAIIPYNQYLRRLPRYLQQADMESNGKHVQQNGKPVDYATGPIIWGALGSNSQHAFHQLLHQGTNLVPADFIMPVKSHNPFNNHHAILFASLLSQTRALMHGCTQQEAYQELMAEGMQDTQARRLAPYKTNPGNRPSNVILFPKLTPHTLGALIALYEHKIFVQGVIWQINSFDQWGIELGKRLLNTIYPLLDRQPARNKSIDSSTKNLIDFYQMHHKAKEKDPV